MDNDLISREALKKEIDRVFCINSYHKDRIIDLIDNAPTVDIKDQIAGAYNEGYMCGNREAEKGRPQVTVFAENASKKELEDFKKELEKVVRRPQGEWIISKYVDTRRGFITKCSLCKNDTIGGGNFCPNCGADMRGVENDS